ncbi:MAG: hypothetical protein N2376_00175, partial [Clostridia bacterium]|nr:hypothetical protein [Clostridia bacterium]
MSQEPRNRNKRRATLAMLITILVVVVLSIILFPKQLNNLKGQLVPTPGGPTIPPVETTITPEPSELASETPTPSQTPEATPSATPTPTPVAQNGEDRRSTRKLDKPIKALYLNPNSVRTKIDHYIELANKTEINAYV